mmetsp:Transcript_129317/g.360169  ORF Transcript_129317/g.360169 Transcript_129317/m.360169 type:complete len:334 (-) Transcript_129317:256-1257(-)
MPRPRRSPMAPPPSPRHQAQPKRRPSMQSTNDSQKKMWAHTASPNQMARLTPEAPELTSKPAEMWGPVAARGAGWSSSSKKGGMHAAASAATAERPPTELQKHPLNRNPTFGKDTTSSLHMSSRPTVRAIQLTGFSVTFSLLSGVRRSKAPIPQMLSKRMPNTTAHCRSMKPCCRKSGQAPASVPFAFVQFLQSPAAAASGAVTLVPLMPAEVSGKPAGDGTVDVTSSVVAGSDVVETGGVLLLASTLGACKSGTPGASSPPRAPARTSNAPAPRACLHGDAAPSSAGCLAASVPPAASRRSSPPSAAPVGSLRTPSGPMTAWPRRAPAGSQL